MASLTIRLFGFEVFHVTNVEEEVEEEGAEADLSGGTLPSTSIGFVATFERPDEAELPERG